MGARLIKISLLLKIYQQKDVGMYSEILTKSKSLKNHTLPRTGCMQTNSKKN